MTRLPLLRSTAIGAVLMLSSFTAAADNTPGSESMLDPEIGAPQNELPAALGTQDTIVVIADQHDWATALPTQLAVAFHVEAKTTKKKWHVAESYLIVGLAPITSAGVTGACCGAMEVEDFSPYNYATWVQHPGSTNHVDKDAWWTQASVDNSIGTAARNACRNLSADLAQQGLSHDEIFAEDRHTVLPYAFRYVAAVAYTTATGENNYFWKQSQPSYRNFNVVCQKRGVSEITRNPDVQPAGDGNISVGFQVSQAALAATVKDHLGHCPAELHLNPTIETNGPGVVKYRFRDQLGVASPVYQASFAKADIKFLDHVVEIDRPQSQQGGLVAAQGSGGALGLKAPGDPNLVQGYYQMEIVAPHQKVSNIADYSVACTVPTASDDIAIAPDIVNPVIVEGVTAALLKPDLVIEQAQAIPALPNKMFVKISNLGQLASTPTNLKALRAAPGTATVRGTLVPPVQPGQSQVIQVELGGALATATSLQLRVDDPNRIKEADEGNNAFQVK
jgi:hypothetical protein